jgi:GNAT superfamily N-acetyltransferase
MAIQTLRPCTSDYPDKCRYHGDAAKLKQANVLENKIQALLSEPDKSASTPQSLQGKLINQAAISSLEWKGEQPVWWAEYHETAKANEFAPSNAKIIDVIDSPQGKLAVVWQDESQGANIDANLSSGYGSRSCYFKSVETGETVGRVDMAYIDKASMERTFGNDEMTPYRYQSRYSGTTYPFNDDNYVYEDRNYGGEALLEQRRSVWVEAAKGSGKTIYDSNGKYVAYYNIDESHVPDDATVEKDLDEFSVPIKKAMNAARKFHAKPFVSYSEVDDSLKGQGYGSALYVYTARMLAKEGKVLRGSGLQTNEAKKVWERFKEKFPSNVSIVTRTYKGNKHVSPILDFRK